MALNAHVPHLIVLGGCSWNSTRHLLYVTTRRRGEERVRDQAWVTSTAQELGVTIACPDCGVLEDLPRLPPRSTAVCVRCDGDLERTAGRSVNAALACSIATLALLFPSNILPLVSIDVFGQHSQTTIALGIWRLFQHQWMLLAGLSALFVLVPPFVRFGLLTAVLGSLRLGFRPGWLGKAFRWTVWLDLWAMLDVFLLAAGGLLPPQSRE